MVDDPKKSPDSEDDPGKSPKDEAKQDKDEAKPAPVPVPKEEDKDEDEEEEEGDEEEEEEEKPAAKKADPPKKEDPPKKAATKKEPEKKGAPKAAAKKAAEPKPKPKPTGPIIIGPKEFLTPHQEAVVIKKRPALLLAEYPTPGKLLHAAEKLRDAGYKNFDTHSPFPVHGMDAAMGLPDSKLGWIVLTGGLTGITIAVSMIWWMNGVDYPIIIGGKPGFALPSSVPIMFELTVLLSSFAAVFGMLGLNKLPRHHHPIFESERFNAATDDKFFVSVEAEDPKFDLKKTRMLLESTHADAVEVVEEELEPEPVTQEDH